MIYIWFTYDLLFNFHFLEGFLVSCLFLFFISWFILLIYTIDMLNYADMLCPIAQLLLLLSHCRWTLWRSLGSPAEVSPTCGSRRNISLLQVVCFPPYLAHMMCNIIYNRHISCLNLLDSSHMLNVCHIRLWMAYFGSKFFKPRNAKKCQDMPRCRDQLSVSGRFKYDLHGFRMLPASGRVLHRMSGMHRQFRIPRLRRAVEVQQPIASVPRQLPRQPWQRQATRNVEKAQRRTGISWLILTKC